MTSRPSTARSWTRRSPKTLPSYAAPVRPLSGDTSIAAQGPGSTSRADSSFLTGAVREAAPTALILSLLPRGRARATSIPSLVRASGLSEREVRQALHELVTEHHQPVVTLPVPRGVWLAETAEEAQAAADQLHSRAMSLLERCRGLRIAGERLAWNPQLF
jgi:hypothetical protein